MRSVDEFRDVAIQDPDDAENHTQAEAPSANGLRTSRSCDNQQPEVERLRSEVDRLYREITDCQNALLTSNQHGDVLQDHLYRLSCSLTAEVKERQAAEEKLQQVVKAITREKGDLEVLVQILIDQGDSFAEEGEKARIDGLTQIPNRRRMDEYLIREWGRHARLQQPLSFLLCDVDHFKLYNDHYGHQAGDECLKAVSRAIAGCLRSDDLIARYGGEEFAIIMPHTPLPRALQIGEMVRVALATLSISHAASPVCPHVTISIGVACKTPPRDSTDARALVEEADRNLYVAKSGGRNRVIHWEKGNVRV